MHGEDRARPDPGINADFDYTEFNQNTYGRLDARPRRTSSGSSGTYTFPFGLIRPARTSSLQHRRAVQPVRG